MQRANPKTPRGGQGAPPTTKRVRISTEKVVIEPPSAPPPAPPPPPAAPATQPEGGIKGGEGGPSGPPQPPLKVAHHIRSSVGDGFNFVYFYYEPDNAAHEGFYNSWMYNGKLETPTPSCLSLEDYLTLFYNDAPVSFADNAPPPHAPVFFHVTSAPRFPIKNARPTQFRVLPLQGYIDRCVAMIFDDAPDKLAWRAAVRRLEDIPSFILTLLFVIEPAAVLERFPNLTQEHGNIWALGERTLARVNAHASTRARPAFQGLCDHLAQLIPCLGDFILYPSLRAGITATEALYMALTSVAHLCFPDPVIDKQIDEITKVTCMSPRIAAHVVKAANFMRGGLGGTAPLVFISHLTDLHAAIVSWCSLFINNNAPATPPTPSALTLELDGGLGGAARPPLVGRTFIVTPRAATGGMSEGILRHRLIDGHEEAIGVRRTPEERAMPPGEEDVALVMMPTISQTRGLCFSRTVMTKVPSATLAAMQTRQILEVVYASLGTRVNTSGVPVMLYPYLTAACVWHSGGWPAVFAMAAWMYTGGNRVVAESVFATCLEKVRDKDYAFYYNKAVPTILHCWLGTPTTRAMANPRLLLKALLVLSLAEPTQYRFSSNALHRASASVILDVLEHEIGPNEGARFLQSLENASTKQDGVPLLIYYVSKQLVEQHVKVSIAHLEQLVYCTEIVGVEEKLMSAAGTAAATTATVTLSLPMARAPLAHRNVFPFEFDGRAPGIGDDAHLDGVLCALYKVESLFRKQIPTGAAGTEQDLAGVCTKLREECKVGRTLYLHPIMRLFADVDHVKSAEHKGFTDVVYHHECMISEPTPLCLPGTPGSWYGISRQLAQNMLMYCDMNDDDVAKFTNIAGVTT